jgi:arylsulfatase A-like enzyme
VQVGKLLAELEKQGLDENTIVVLWGDHGWHLGDHRVWGKHTIFDRALKSACIIRLPGQKEGEIINKVVSTVDMYPTILELCGVDMPHATDGRSWWPLMQDPTMDWEENAFSYFRKGISLKTGRFRLSKYFREEQPVVELYDHFNDPYETNNISNKNQDIVEQLMPLWEKGNTGLYGR